MRFKILSVVLLTVSFTLLGLASGAIPVLGADVPAAAESGPLPTGSPAAVPTPAADPTAAPEPTASPAPTAEPSDAPEPTTEPEPEPTAAPEEPAEEAEAYWTPEAEVLTTTITWTDPIKNSTSLAVDGASLIQESPAICLPAEGPQILIIHTHATEAYTPDGSDRYPSDVGYRTMDTDQSVVRVGEALAQALRGWGLNVIHDEGIYDWPSYNGSYAQSEAAIRAHLEQDPGIAMVIDLHRDALGTDETVYRTVADREADPAAAQIMFVVGTDVNLTHPNWRDNLALAMSLQGLAEAKYPHLTRPTLLSTYRYNQQLTAGSLILEVGTTGNTLQEAITAVEQFADAVGPALAARVGA